MARQNAYGGDYVEARNPVLDTSSAISGQVTGVGVGTAVQGGSVTFPNGVYLKALTGNAGTVWVGNTGAGSVAGTTGFQLMAGDMILVQVANLNQLYFDAPTTDKVCWIGA